MKKEEQGLFVIPDYDGELPIRGGIHAPIHRPSLFTKKEVVQILNAGIKIYSVNSKNKKERKLVSFRNISDQGIFGMKGGREHRDRKIVRPVLSYAAPHKTAESLNYNSQDGNSSISTQIVDEKVESGKTIEDVVRPDFF